MTNNFTIPPNVWTKVSDGPCFVQCVSHNAARVHAGTVVPAIDTLAFHPLSKAEPFTSGSQEPVWVMTTSDRDLQIVVTESV